MKDSIWFAWHTEARMWKAAAGLAPAGFILGFMSYTAAQAWWFH